MSLIKGYNFPIFKGYLVRLLHTQYMQRLLRLASHFLQGAYVSTTGCSLEDIIVLKASSKSIAHMFYGI